MQPDRIRHNLRAIQSVEHSRAYVLLYWDGSSLQTVEATEIESEEELERFVLALAMEGNVLLRRLLKHRLEKQ